MNLCKTIQRFVLFIKCQSLQKLVMEWKENDGYIFFDENIVLKGREFHHTKICYKQVLANVQVNEINWDFLFNFLWVMMLLAPGQGCLFVMSAVPQSPVQCNHLLCRRQILHKKTCEARVESHDWHTALACYSWPTAIPGKVQRASWVGRCTLGDTVLPQSKDDPEFTEKLKKRLVLCRKL